MHLSLTALFRTLVWVATGIIVIAIGLGRYAPRMPVSRHPALPRYHAVNRRVYTDREYQPRFLDRATGAVFEVEFSGADTLDYAVCSPWHDERGQYQVVGRWQTRSGTAGHGGPRGFGLARYTLPEGRLLDRVELEVVPMANPCWLPGLAPRVLFVAGDGAIYHFAFEGSESEGDPPMGVREPARPRKVAWSMAWPGRESVFIRDLLWPTEPELGGRLIASLSLLERIDGRAVFGGTRLWWLQLSGDGTTVVAAGRLTAPESEGPADVLDDEERFPQIASTPAGGLALAYLRRTREEPRWEMHVAPIATDPGRGTPVVRRGSSRGLARDCLATAPAFSADGRWVYGIINPHLGSSPRRFSVAATLGRPEGVAIGPGTRSQPPWAGPTSRPGRIELALFPPNRLVPAGPRRHAGR